MGDTPRSSRAETLRTIAEGLLRADAYPKDPSATRGIEHIETHISHLFLTRDFVYKLRKAAYFGFLDFRTLEQRHADCLNELRLNRRLSPDVYLGVAPVVGAPERPSISDVDELITTPLAEHCVVMRRLPHGYDAQSLLEAGRLSEDQIELIARRIARFHEMNTLVWSTSADAWTEHISSAFEASLDEIDDATTTGHDRHILANVRERSRAELEERRDALATRLDAGRVVDGHGDLRLEHVWFEPGRPQPAVIDGVEFSQELRRIDPVSDLAFLTMDLRWNLRDDLAERLLSEYAATMDDYGAYAVISYFEAYRSCVRAKVAHLKRPAARMREHQQLDTARRERLDLAARLLEPRDNGRLVVLCGIVGTGKSTAARELARSVGGIVLSSDELRPGVRSSERTEIHRGLLRRARPVIESGRTAILDATFSRAAWRREALDAAAKLGVDPLLIETSCNPSKAMQRLAERKARGDASDAGPEDYERSAAEHEPPDDWPEGTRLRLDTTADSWRRRASRFVLSQGTSRAA